MDELGFYVPSTLFQSFQDDGRVKMKDSVQCNQLDVTDLFVNKYCVACNKFYNALIGMFFS